MERFKMSDYFSKGYIFFIILIFVLPNLRFFQYLNPIVDELKKDYSDYFEFKQSHSLSEVYTNYNKISNIEMIALNTLSENSIKSSVYKDYERFVDDYFKITNKKYEDKYYDQVKSQIDTYISKYKFKQYLLLLRNIFIYLLIIILGTFLFDFSFKLITKKK